MLFGAPENKTAGHEFRPQTFLHFIPMKKNAKKYYDVGNFYYFCQCRTKNDTNVMYFASRAAARSEKGCFKEDAGFRAGIFDFSTDCSIAACRDSMLYKIANDREAVVMTKWYVVGESVVPENGR